MDPTERPSRTFGPFQVTDTGNIIRKKKSQSQNTDGLTTPQAADCTELCAFAAEDPWRATGDAGTIKTGSKNAMRLDVQPSESGVSNTAIQNNIQPKTASNSYSSVSVTDACFTAETYRKGSNFGRALQYAHQQSLANRTIFEITLVQVASKVAPKARTINCTSTDNCKGKISVPATMKPGASLMCPKCFQYQKV
jgi:hypothetical protein